MEDMSATSRKSRKIRRNRTANMIDTSGARGIDRQ
jgi:hypothetical protein